MTKLTYVIEVPMDETNENHNFTYILESAYGAEFVKHTITTTVEKYLSDVSDLTNQHNPFKFFGETLESKINKVDSIMNIEDYIFEVNDFIDIYDEVVEFNVYTLEEWLEIKKEYGKKEFED